MNTDPNIHIPGVLKALAQHGLPHRLIQARSPENRVLTEWTDTAFPWGFSQIEWGRVTSHRCAEWASIEDLVSEFHSMLSAVESSSPVVVMWANALCPSLEMRLEDAARIAREIFEEHETSTDVLIFNRSDGWLIEMNHEGTLCLGRSEIR